MSLRSQVLNEVDDLIGEHASSIFGAIERSILRKQSEPDRWYAFHSEMKRRLPKRARIRKAWHTMRARRFKSLIGAQPDLTASLAERFPGV